MSIALLTHHPYIIAVIAALPWCIAPIITLTRLMHSRLLRDESATPPDPSPSVSIVIPARNEARNIEACIRAALTSTYPALRIIVVDDHSTDATGAIARTIAVEDPRVYILPNPDLPPGWFGKQWACQNGANAFESDILIFVDADTRMTPDTVTRSVNGMQREHAALYSVLSQQEMHSFWERIIQPQILTMLAWRYGGTESVNRSRHFYDKIANGQYLMLRRTDYDALGGHGLVRAYVAEDLMLAQKYFAAGRTTILALGLDHITTRMYTSLTELINGWRKNVYAGGRESIPGGTLGQFVYPIVLLLMPAMQIAPILTLLASALGLVSPAISLWATITTVTWLAWWTFTYAVNKQPLRYALYFPLGATMMAYIFITAIARGHRVSWKERSYINVPASAK